MKKLLYFLLFVTTLNTHAQFTHEEAITIVINEVVGADSLDSHNLFSKKAMMFQNDTIWQEYFIDFLVCPFQENWVFFVDDMPPAFWNHPCRYVFFDVFTGEYLVYNDDWPPFQFFQSPNSFLQNWKWIIGTEVEENPFQHVKGELTVYPNPFSEILNIVPGEDIEGVLTFQLMDYIGKIAFEKTTTSGNSLTIKTGYLKTGMYFLFVFHEDQLIRIEKIVKQD